MRVRGSAAGGLSGGASASGAALAFADVGRGRWTGGAAVRVVCPGLDGAEVVGSAAPSGWSPCTARVLIFLGSLFGNVPPPLVIPEGGATLAAEGGLPF